MKEIPTTFHFEDTRTENGYYVFYETSGTQELTWASGNGGFRLAINDAEPSEYPTTLEEKGFSGKCAKLVTRTTGSLGAMVGMPIAAGNLFIGKFNLSNALSNSLKATQLGVEFYHKPLKLKGYYKYTPGNQFYENGGYTNRNAVLLPPIGIWYIWRRKDKHKLNLPSMVVWTMISVVILVQYIILLVQSIF